MEKILVLSDIHRRLNKAIRAVELHPECQTIIFLGDGADYADILRDSSNGAAVVAVRGNCDGPFCTVRNLELVLNIGSHRLFICHGHTKNVKSGLGGLLSAAKSAGADIALFGHTHIPHEEYVGESGIYLFNPGSIGEPRGGECSYGILSLDGKNVLFSIGYIDE